MRVLIVYCFDTFSTAKELRDTIIESGIECKMSKRFVNGYDGYIFWGVSNINKECNNLLNTIDANRASSDKLLMMRLLKSCGDINTPNVLFCNEPDILSVRENMFFRNRNHKVEYRDAYVRGDLYASIPINVKREFRVHVYNGKVMGVYEKIPREGEAIIKKFANCDFKRLDMGNRDVKLSIRGVRPAAVKAVEALGLKFGGVDVVISERDYVYVLEVNSAPGLTKNNCVRLVNNIFKNDDTTSEE